MAFEAIQVPSCYAFEAHKIGALHFELRFISYNSNASANFSHILTSFSSNGETWTELEHDRTFYFMNIPKITTKNRKTDRKNCETTQKPELANVCWNSIL